MSKRTFCLALLFVAVLATQSPASIGVIYTGNNASFAGSATNPGSNQGFTALQARWNNVGVATTITSVFDPIGKDIFYMTAPSTLFTAGQVSDLTTFLSDGGHLVLSHDGFAIIPTLNTLLSDLGSGMQFGPTSQFSGTAVLDVIAPGNGFMANLPDGPTLTAFSAGSVTGGTPLAEASGGFAVIAEESLLGGTILAVADFDLLNNVTELVFGPASRPNNRQFQDNIGLWASSAAIPEPTTFIVWSLLGLAAVGVKCRRNKKA